MATDLENFYQRTPGGPWYRNGERRKYRPIDCPNCGEPCMVTGPSKTCSTGCAKRGVSNPGWSGDKASYRALHKRLDRERGLASDHECPFPGPCSARMTWCFSEVGTRNCLDDYFPACALHHNRYESAVRMMQKDLRPGSDGRWRPWRYVKGPAIRRTIRDRRVSHGVG